MALIDTSGDYGEGRSEELIKRVIAGQRDRAFRRVENILLVDRYPRQRAAFRGQLIAQACQFLFPFEQILARDQPFFSRNNFVV